MSKGRIVWISRDSCEHAQYELWTGKPSLFGGDFYSMTKANRIHDMRVSQFEQITGYKLQPGECRKIRIRIEEVK